MLTLALACIGLVAPNPTPTDEAGTVLFRDDFDAPTLGDEWATGDWTLSRSRLGNEISVEDGKAILTFDTFDPQQPGQATLGSELFTRRLFGRPEGGVLQVEARVRLDQSLPPGIVASIFTYVTEDHGDGQVSDEIDFEFLTTLNRVGTGSSHVTCTTWNDWNAKTPDYEDSRVVTSETIVIDGTDLYAFHVYRFRWHEDRIEWFVDGQLIRTAETAVPDTAAPIRFNLWAAAEGWAKAYSGDLQPAKTAETNERSTYEIDYVEIRSLPAEKD